MAISVLPPIIPDEQEQRATYDRRVDLGGDYRIQLRYAPRLDRWYFDLYDAADDPLVQGLRVSTDTPLITRRKYPSEDFPDGSIYCFRIDGSKDEPGFEDLGRNALLYWIPTADKPEIPPLLEVDFVVKLP